MGKREGLTQEQWERIEPLLPPIQGPTGRLKADHRKVIEGIVHRYRCGLAWRDLPERFGPWQTVWKRHHAWSADGTWDEILAQLLADADAGGGLDWKVSVDSTVVRAHQHATNIHRDESGPSSDLGAHTGGPSNDKNRAGPPDEPVDHGFRRSRGGLSTKAHTLVDGHGRPLVISVSPGQAGDSPCLPILLAQLRVGRRGRGRPRTRPVLLRADKAYSSRANRTLLRHGVSRRSSPSPPTRPATATGEAQPVAGPSTSMPRSTRAAT